MNIKHAVVALAFGFGTLVMANVSAGEVEDRISERLTEAVPGLQVISVKESEAKGLYEVQSNNGDTIYATEDGQYLMTGDLLKITDQGIANVTEAARADARRQTMADFGDEGVISFPPKRKGGGGCVYRHRLPLLPEAAR